MSDIQDAAGVMTETGTGATSAGKEATSFSQNMENQVNDITTLLTQHFNDMAEALRQAIHRAAQRLARTDWEGRSKEEADQAEAQLNRRVDKVLINALQSTADFKQLMLSRTNDFSSVVRSDFTTIMGNVDAAYQDLDKASQTFAETLQTADEPIRFTG